MDIALQTYLSYLQMVGVGAHTSDGRLLGSLVSWLKLPTTRPSIGATMAEKHCSISKVDRLLDVQANKQLSECHETRAVTGCPFKAMCHGFCVFNVTGVKWFACLSAFDDIA